MSKVVFLGLPFQGHTNPTLEMVKELIKKGEQIIYYSRDDFKEIIEKTGAVYRSYPYYKNWDIDFVSEQMIHSTRVRSIKDLIKKERETREFNNSVLKDILEEVKREKPDYLFYDSNAKWGIQIAGMLDIPAICSSTMFEYCHEMYETDPDFALKYAFLVDEDYLQYKKKFISFVNRMHSMEKKVLNSKPGRKNMSLVFTSKMFQPYGKVFEDRYKFVGPSITPRTEQVDFPYELLNGKPLIYISLGTIISNHQNCIDFSRSCFKAFANSEYQIVLSVGKKTDLSSLEKVPDNFIVRNYVPQLEMLKRARVFITHSGMNSVTEGIYYKVPLVVYPQGFDQLAVAYQVESLGAGIYIKTKKLTADDLSSAVEKIIADVSYKRECNKISESFTAAGGYQKAVEEIFAFKKENNI